MTATEEDFVRALGRVLTALPRAVELDMARAGRLPLSEYEALRHLSETENHALRMNELAAAADLSLSGMTRIVNRLEQRGLVTRMKCAEDGRGWNAVLTDAGLAALEDSWPVHLASVRRHLLDHVAGEDLAQFTSVLKRIAVTS
ncbi:MarR family transcriptional regulator [Streptomyces sp. PLK6-54]|uniref:MarR family transcriptional regulator n=2 Tax=Actinacidiphila acidipaludis TaxID=2873382 RepID=A0ABS7Q957_9ACTN|nr:MarR family transcriptional regulator [Streptomyces acidipaludis]